MRKLVLSAAVLCTLVVSQSALADHRFRQHGYNSFNSWGVDRRFNRGFSNRFNAPRANPYHFGGYSNRGRNNFVSISYGNRFGNHGWNRGWNRWDRGNRWNHRGGWNNGDFVGGLVLGSVLSNSVRAPQVVETVTYRSAPVTREVVYVNRSQPRTTATPRRKLLRDLNGNCYQIDYRENGDEVRSELDPRECGF